MKRPSLIGSGLIVSSVLCLSACEEGVEAGKRNSIVNHAIDSPVEDVGAAKKKQ